ncbi:MAG: hypothetical protein ACW98I_13825 [Candidatus Hodarchaeales archaeon]|jgi:hypothetical protein
MASEIVDFPYKFEVKLTFFSNIEEEKEQAEIVPEIIDFLFDKYPFRFNVIGELLP